jgi:glycosyltransferase involved in cell wall biosynthesis
MAENRNQSKIRILHIGPIPPEVGGEAAGGIATHLWELAVQSWQRGYDIDIFASSNHSLVREGVNIIGIPGSNKFSKIGRALGFWLNTRRSSLNPLGPGEQLRTSYLASLLRDIIIERKPDLIHLHSLLNPAGLALGCLDLSIPLVVTNYELWFDGPPVRDMAIANRIAARASYLIHISEYTENRARLLGLRYQGRGKVVYMPIREDRVALIERAKAREGLGLGEKMVVFFYGTFQPVRKKGLDMLLEAFASNSDLRDSCSLVIRTGTEGAQYARVRFEREGIDGQVLSRLPWDEMVRYYNASNLFVMPSRSEGFGIAYIEALLAGTPVVGFYRTLGEIEKIVGTNIGERFDAETEDPESLARKMLKVLKTDFDRRLLRDSVLGSLLWKDRFWEYDNVYREVLKDE